MNNIPASGILPTNPQTGDRLFVKHKGYKEVLICLDGCWNFYQGNRHGAHYKVPADYWKEIDIITEPNGKIKIAKDRDEAFKIEEKYKDQPHGWIQWKGTGVCMDIHCKCGTHSHIDAEFAYSVKCPSCGTVYSCNGHIEFIELLEEPENLVVIGENEEPE